MRHRKLGRTLGRTSSHRRALLRNLASSLFLTERGEDDLIDNAPKVKGRIITTLPKAKEVRYLVEKCITLARRAHQHLDAAKELEIDAERNTPEWEAWRNSEKWQQWNHAISPAVNARRRCIQLLGNKEAVSILFDTVAPRFLDRDGGYTRVLKLAKPRLGDAGIRAILEFVGQNDRVSQKSEKPAFEEPSEESASEESVEAETATSEETDSADGNTSADSDSNDNNSNDNAETTEKE
ncbi:MAG: 50S ribosomal protein L17 [Pirellulaceae bacterium]|nr:50S ribosomal protein L17 [Pirellulaceae bacterium]